MHIQSIAFRCQVTKIYIVNEVRLMNYFTEGTLKNVCYDFSVTTSKQAIIKTI